MHALTFYPVMSRLLSEIETRVRTAFDYHFKIRTKDILFGNIRELTVINTAMIIISNRFTYRNRDY